MFVYGLEYKRFKVVDVSIVGSCMRKGWIGVRIVALRLHKKFGVRV